jgi:hypothetical protein
MLLIAGVALALAMAPAAASAAAVHGRYTTIDVPGAAATIAVGVNDLGVVVGFDTDSSGVNHGFVDRDGVFTTINDPHTGAAPGQVALPTASDSSNSIGITSSKHQFSRPLEWQVSRGRHVLDLPGRRSLPSSARSPAPTPSRRSPTWRR